MKYRSAKVGLILIAVVGSLVLAGMAQQTSGVGPSTPSSANSAVVPQLVNYSGVLTDVNGKPLTGVVGVTFALYQDSEGGTPLWMEIQNVQPTKSGHYTVMLGSTSSTGLPQDVFITGQARWLGVQVEGQAEQPRVLLVAVPYALKAGDAETIGGLPSSAFMLANGASGSTDAAKPATAAASSGASKNSTPPANPAVTGKGTVNYIPMWDTTSDIIDSMIFQKSSAIGIGTTAPAATLDVNGKTDVRDTLTLFPKSTDNTLAVSGSTFNISSLGKVTFITGQTFPGAGTITGVTTASGSGLSGGGTTGTLSLKVPAAGITNAMLADSKVTLNASTAGGLTVPGAMTLGSAYTIGLKTCTANQVLQYNGTAWACASAGTGTVTSVGSGAGLAGGPITGSGTLSIASAGVTNTMLQNSNLTLNASTAGGLTVPGAMTLGSTYTIGLKTCSSNQVLQYNGTTWACASVGTGTVTSVGSGAGLTGGPITGTGSLSIATAGVSNAMLANSSLTISPGADLTGGGAVALGGSTTLSLDTTKVPLLAAANTFSTNQTVNGTLTASSFSGNGAALTNVTSANSSELGGLASGAYAQLAAANTFSNNQTVNGTLTATSSNYAIVANSSSGSVAAIEAFGVEEGVAGLATSTLGAGVYGIADATTGITYGVYGADSSTSGYGVYGSSPNTGVYGSAAGASEIFSGPAGVWGDTAAESGSAAGVLGTAADNIAGYFVSTSTALPTLFAYNFTGTFGGEAFNAYMESVVAQAVIGDPGCNVGFIALQLGQYGMSGCTDYTLAGGNNGQTYINSANSLTGAVHLRINSVDVLEATSGNVSITGTLNATGTKNFRIDHPLDPANKYLLHASIESSEVLNLYSGNVVLDASGEAVVQLPDWFEAINKDFRYQLTPIGAPGRDLYVAEEVSGGHFKIAGGKPGGKISWQVSGVRNDAWEKAHPMVVEADKGAARGQYLTPELYGAPETARIGYMAPAPGSENIVHHRPTIQKRGNASPSQLRPPPSIPLPPKPVAPKVSPLPHPAAPATKAEVNQK
jgi:hypothetical protein